MRYIPPIKSRYVSVDYFEELNNFLLEYANKDYSHLLCDYNLYTVIILEHVIPKDCDNEDVESNADLC